MMVNGEVLMQTGRPYIMFVPKVFSNTFSKAANHVSLNYVFSFPHFNFCKLKLNVTVKIFQHSTLEKDDMKHRNIKLNFYRWFSCYKIYWHLNRLITASGGMGLGNLMVDSYEVIFNWQAHVLGVYRIKAASPVVFCYM